MNPTAESVLDRMKASGRADAVFRTILANLSRQKLRLVATGLAVLLGVAFTSGTLVLTDTLGATFDNLFSDVYHGTDAVVRSSTVVKVSIEGAGSGTTRGLISDSFVPQIEKIPGVAAVAGSVSAGGTSSGYAQIVGKNGKALGNPNRGTPTLGGAWVDSPALNPYRLYTGRAPKVAGEVVIDKYSADQTGYKLGNVFEVLTPTGTINVKLVGIAKFGTSDSAGGASQVLFTTTQAQTVNGTPGKFGEIRVQAKPGVSQQQLVQNISKVLPSSTRRSPAPPRPRSSRTVSSRACRSSPSSCWCSPLSGWWSVPSSSPTPSRSSWRSAPGSWRCCAPSARAGARCSRRWWPRRRSSAPSRPCWAWGWASCCRRRCSS